GPGLGLPSSAVHVHHATLRPLLRPRGRAARVVSLAQPAGRGPALPHRASEFAPRPGGRHAGPRPSVLYGRIALTRSRSNLKEPIFIMSTTFMSADKTLLTSESVTEGHPDKVCDLISDSVLDAVFTQDPYGRVACEAAAKSGLILVLGEVTTTAQFDAQDIARNVLKEIGYDDSSKCLDYKTAGVIVGLQKQ